MPVVHVTSHKVNVVCFVVNQLINTQDLFTLWDSNDPVQVSLWYTCCNVCSVLKDVHSAHPLTVDIASFSHLLHKGL